MTNHVHLIVEPTDKAEDMALLMNRVAGRQTRYVNKLEGRYVTLWEWRYKSSPVDSDEYLLACCRYMYS
jgi:putative transposase